MAGQGVVYFSEGMTAQIRRELREGGVVLNAPVRDDEEQAIERGASACPGCETDDQRFEAIEHHNLRVAELGERSYPCTGGRR